MTKAPAAIDAALAGDFAELLAAREGGGAALVGAWAVAADALCWLAGLRAEPPAAVSLDGEGTALAARLLATSAALRFDVEGLEALEALSQPSMAGAWLRGDPDELERLERRAAVANDAALVIDAAALRAFALSARGDEVAALEHARRASRMARTEAMPQQEYLANLVLARLRRLAGQPYASARILGALRRFAPPPWHRWIDWELAMATGQGPPGEAAAAHLIPRLLAGDDTGQAIGFGPLDEDLHRLRAAMGLTEAASGELARWCAGEGDKPPHGLVGVVANGAEDATIACVFARPGERARRMLSAGRAFLEGDVAELPGTSRTFARTDAILATLLLAGEPVAMDALFRLVWGFKYSPSVHRAVFDTALHRARTRLGDHGTVERDGESLSIRLERPLVVPDPRCVAPPEERVLLYVASHASASAQEASRALDIPLRSVQSFLKALVADGACQREKRGRRVAYTVEDTTFREPTGHRRP